jgi:hypothetical protein
VGTAWSPAVGGIVDVKDGLMSDLLIIDKIDDDVSKQSKGVLWDSVFRIW